MQTAILLKRLQSIEFLHGKVVFPVPGSPAMNSFFTGGLPFSLQRKREI
jgi:hypothetical protein